MACETQQRPDLRTKVGPGEREVARGLPNTAAAKARYEKARDTAVDWVRKQLKVEGLEKQFKVSPDEIRSKELLR